MSWGRKGDRTGLYRQVGQAKMGCLREEEPAEKATPGQNTGNSANVKHKRVHLPVVACRIGQSTKKEGGPGGVCLATLGRSN